MNGAVTWGKQGNTDVVSDAFASGVAVYGTGPTRKIFVTGGFAGRIKPRLISVGSLGNHDLFVTRYTSMGLADWTQRAGNIYTATNRNHFDHGTGIGVDNGENVYVVGEFGGSGVNDARFFNVAPDLSSDHFRNVFVAKILPNAERITGEVKTVGGIVAPDRVVQIENDPPTTVVDYAITDNNGQYSFYVKPGKYKVNLYREMTSWSWNPQAGYAITTAGSGATFGDSNLVMSSISDTNLRISIRVQSTEYAVPQSQYPESPVSYLISFDNLGSAPVNNASIFLDRDTRLIYKISASTVAVNGPSPNSPPGSNGLYTWSIINPIPPLGHGEILVHFDFPQPAEQDPPVLHSTVSITQYPGEPTSDNQATVDQEIFFPSDPNGKTVMPKGNVGVTDVRQGLDLTYTVRFFNQGAAIANKVTVTDEFDPAFFNVTGNSSIDVLSYGPVMPVTAVTVPPPPPSPTATFEFNLANLDPMHESVSGSFGFVTFTVPLARTLAIGTKIPNKASIVFDDEAAIPTNQVETCVSSDFRFENACIGMPVRFFSEENGDDYLWEGPDAVSSVSWDFGDSTPLISTRNPTHTFARPGTYTITLLYRFDKPVRICDVLDLVHVVVRTVTIDSLPSVQISRSGDTLRSTPALHYQWYRNGVKLSNRDTLQSYNMNGVTGNYQVRVRNRGDCEAVSGTIGVPVETGAARTIGIHPNPGSGVFTLALGRSSTRELKVSILDVRGGVVLETNVAAGETQCDVNLVGKSSGIYTARVVVDGEIVTRRFVLQR